MIAHRLSHLRTALRQGGLDAILVSQPENRFYLSGFSGSAGYLLITSREAILATDFRYVEQVKQQAPDFTLFEMKGRTADWLPQLIGDRAIQSFGFEAAHLTVASHKEISGVLETALPGIKLIPVEHMVETLRGVKEAEEIQLISLSADVADHAFEAVTASLKPSVTEAQVAWALEKAMRESGSGAMPFEVIVAAGPNAALPHHQPSDRPIAAGEPVVIDMGARYQHYCSDMTRTIILGTADAAFRKVYGVVQRAQEAAIDGIRAGMNGVEADELARRIIRDAGYADMFGHGLGHGVGLATHDPYPRLSPLATVGTLEDGMVFSIEPGVYLPGWGGVRIEDLAVMENGRVRLLSHAHKWQDR